MWRWYDGKSCLEPGIASDLLNLLEHDVALDPSWIVFLLRFYKGYGFWRGAMPRTWFNEDTPPPIPQDPKKLRKYPRVIMHVMQRVVTQDVTEDAGFEGHGVTITVSKAQEGRVNTAICFRPILKTGLQFAVNIKGHGI